MKLDLFAKFYDVLGYNIIIESGEPHVHLKKRNQSSTKKR